MTTTVKCNRKQLCGYLKKIFIKDGKEEVNKYNDYLKKELNKKKISLERFQEVQDQLSTVSWWMDNVMPKYNLETLRNEKHERETRKESKTVTYLCSKIISGEMSLEDIKSEGYRLLVKDYFDNTPFGLPSTSNSALVMADKVQETVMTMKPEENHLISDKWFTPKSFDELKQLKSDLSSLEEGTNVEITFLTYGGEPIEDMKKKREIIKRENNNLVAWRGEKELINLVEGFSWYNLAIRIAA